MTDKVTGISLNNVRYNKPAIEATVTADMVGFFYTQKGWQMNKAKGNMYGFITHTWNPISGTCIHDCSYCYMKRWKLPTVHLNERVLHKNLGKNKIIFVGSGTDMFAENVSRHDIIAVLDKTCTYNLNTYLFQSKNPKKMLSFCFPQKSILCTTIESNQHHLEMGAAPNVKDRIEAMIKLKEAGYRTMVTIEPIMDFDLDDLVQIIKEIDPIQVNIGADSKHSEIREPGKDKIEALISSLELFTTVHIKDNLKRLIEAV